MPSSIEVCDLLEELVSELPAGTVIIVTPGKDQAADAVEDLAEGEMDDPYWMFQDPYNGGMNLGGGGSGGSTESAYLLGVNTP